MANAKLTDLFQGIGTIEGDSMSNCVMMPSHLPKPPHGGCHFLYYPRSRQSFNIWSRWTNTQIGVL